MDMILSELDRWGCDVTGAMNRCFGDTDFYLRWVKEFAVDPGFERLDRELEQMKYKEAFRTARLDRELEQMKYKEAFRTAHGLKGDAGMLGLTPLLLAICEIVEDLRHEPSPRLGKDYEAVKKEYETFVNILRNNRE